MKNLYCLLLTVCVALFASAQKVYFIYLQTDNYAPFYVKMSDQIYSSSTSGYLIWSNLRDSTYNFSIGLPSSQTESRFAITLGGKDHGFLIKNFQTGLGLFDLQTLSVINALKDESPKNISYRRRSDDFSSLLSKAADDTSLLYAVVRIKEEVTVQNEQPKPEEIKQKAEEPAVLKDTSFTKPVQIVALENKQDTSASIGSNSETIKQEDIANIKNETKKDSTTFGAQKESQNLVDPTVDSTAKKTDAPIITSTIPEQALVFKRSQIKKHSESSTSEGFGLVFYDTYDGAEDTIRLLIPNPPITLRQTDQDSSEQQKDFIHVDELKKDTSQQIPIVVSVKNNATATSLCKSTATGNDFFKLRKNMASKTTDEAMVAEAKKIFKAKCFTTEQIKNLSGLFLTSAGKYQFFDAAYLHVTDREKFYTLESELKDDYYLKRFKALIGE